MRVLPLQCSCCTCTLNVNAAVIDPLGGDKTEAFLNRLREVGRSQRDLMARHFVLGYLDGIRWEGFVRQFNIEKHQLPRFFVLDYTKQTFYEDDEVDEVDEIEQYLADIVAGKVGRRLGTSCS